MNILIIGNPIASGGNAARRIDKLAEILTGNGHSVETYLTRFSGDGKETISRAGNAYDRLVVVGGDGTLNEIINGISDDFVLPILHLPTGNANLVAKDLCLPDTPQGAADLLENGRTIMADVAVMNGAKFIMVAGAGFDARVTETLTSTRSGKVSNFSYILPIMKVLKNRDSSSFLVTIDGVTQAQGEMVLVCNVRNYAGICEIATDAAINSGVLDVVILNKVGIVSLTAVFIMAKLGRIKKMPGVTYVQGRNVRINADYPIPMQLDGDFYGRHDAVNIKLLPEKVPLIAP